MQSPDFQNNETFLMFCVYCPIMPNTIYIMLGICTCSGVGVGSGGRVSDGGGGYGGGR